jgi:hypothetical protein
MIVVKILLLPWIAALPNSLPKIFLVTISIYRSIHNKSHTLILDLILRYSDMPPKHDKGKGKEIEAPKTQAAKGKGKSAAYNQVHELRDAQDRLKENVPILFAVLSRVNKKNAREWALAFERGGFTDHWFPVQKEQAMADTCRRLELKLTPKELEDFCRLQWGYFVRPVKDGEIDYLQRQGDPSLRAIPSPWTSCPWGIRGS